MLARFLAALTAIGVSAFSASSLAQVKQSGSITPGHAVRWVSNGVVGDAGTAASGMLTTLGVTNNGGPGFCINTAPITQPYNQLCLQATTSGNAQLSYNAFGGATAGGLTFVINGVASGLALVNLPVTAGNVACFADTGGTLEQCATLPIPFADPTASIGLTAVNGVSTSAMRADAAPALSQAIEPTWTATHTFTNATLAAAFNGGGITISPTALSTEQGYVITQTSPTSGSVSGPLQYNLISVNNQIGVTSSGPDPWATNYATTLEVKMVSGGANVTGFQIPLRVRYDHTVGASDIGAAADHIALSAVAYSDQNANGRGMWALSTAARAGSGANHPLLVGGELECHILTGATVQWCEGVRAYLSSTAQGTLGIDSAFTVKADAGVGWNKLIAFGIVGDAQALSATADFFWSNQTMTVANIFNLSNVTCTGDVVLIGTVTRWGCDGSIGLGTSTLSQRLNISINSVTANGSGLANTNTGGVASWTAINDSVLVGDFGIRGSARGTYGALVANDAYAYGNTNFTVMADAASSVIRFAAGGTTPSEKARVGSGFMVGTTTDPGAGIINVLTGFRIGNVATSGNVLRGDGTNFISTQLSFADLQSGTTAPAFTLGGTVTGNSQSITGLNALTATTLSGSTSTTSPLIIGGSGTTGTQLTFKTTTGVGTTDAFAWVRGNNGGTSAMTLNNTALTVINLRSVVGGAQTISSATTGAMEITQTLTASADSVSFLRNRATMDGTAGGTSNQMLGLDFFPTFAPTANVARAINQFGAFGAPPTSVTIAALEAMRAQLVYNDVAGAVTTGSVIRVNTPTILGALKPATQNGLIVANQGASGITTSYGIHIEPQSGSTTNYSLWTEGGLIHFVLTTDATRTTRTVCQDTTSEDLYFGSGALGVCLGTSSMRFKRDINAYTHGLDLLVRLEPKEFYYIPGYGDEGARRQVGIMAEDVAEIVPDFVGYDTAGRPNSVDWPNFTWLLINAAKELKAANDNLFQRVEQLERRIAR